MANSTAERQIVSLKIVHTSDVHGSFFMRDYVNNHAVMGSLSRVYAYVQSLRKAYGDRLLLMDGGDILQGSPWCITVISWLLPERIWQRKS